MATSRVSIGWQITTCTLGPASRPSPGSAGPIAAGRPDARPASRPAAAPALPLANGGNPHDDHRPHRSGRPDAYPDPVQGAVPDLGGRGGDQGRHPRRGRDGLGRSGWARARRWPRASAIRPTRRSSAGTDLADRDRARPARPLLRRRVEDIARARLRLARRAASPSPAPRRPCGTCWARPATPRSPSCSAPPTCGSTWGSRRAWRSGCIPASSS